MSAGEPVPREHSTNDAARSAVAWWLGPTCAPPDRGVEIAPASTPGGLAMALRIICMCGYVIEGSDAEELWRNAQEHMAVLHPELVGNVTREDILAQAEQL